MTFVVGDEVLSALIDSIVGCSRIATSSARRARMSAQSSRVQMRPSLRLAASPVHRHHLPWTSPTRRTHLVPTLSTVLRRGFGRPWRHTPGSTTTCSGDIEADMPTLRRVAQALGVDPEAVEVDLRRRQRLGLADQ